MTLAKGHCSSPSTDGITSQLSVLLAPYTGDNVPHNNLIVSLSTSLNYSHQSNITEAVAPSRAVIILQYSSYCQVIILSRLCPSLLKPQEGWETSSYDGCFSGAQPRDKKPEKHQLHSFSVVEQKSEGGGWHIF